MFYLGVSTVCISYAPLSRLGNLVSSLPVNRWEFVDDGLHFLCKENLRYVKDLAASSDLMLSLHAPYTSVNIAATNSIVRRFSMNMYRDVVEHARVLNCRYIVFHPGILDAFTYLFKSLAEPIHDSIRFLVELGDLCDAYGIVPLIENMATNRSTIMSVEDFESLFDLSKSFMMALDIPHGILTGNFDSYVRSLKDRIRYLHISSNDGHLDLHWPLNRGELNWVGALERLLKAGVSGPLIIENLSPEDSRVSLNLLEKFFSIHK